MKNNVTGNLYEKNNKWQMMISYYDEDGKRKQKSKSTGLSVRGNKRNAERMLDELINQYREDSTALYNKDMQLVDLLDEWLTYMENHVRPNTHASYKLVVDAHLIPYFKSKKLRLHEVTTMDIQKYCDYKLKTISCNTVKKHYANLNQALNHAVRMGLIKHNPASAVKLPKKEKFKGDYYTEEEIEILFSLVRGTVIEPVVRLTAFYGFRRSEVLGLRWSAIDWEENVLVVNHTVVKCGTKAMHVDNTKNETSNRILPLTPNIRTYLKELQKKQKYDKLRLGDVYVENDYICKWDTGEEIKPGYVTEKFKKILDATDEIKTIRFHDLRHSAASMLLSLDCSLKEIQEWLGHSDINTTANIYAHLKKDVKTNMASKMDEKIKVS